MGSSIKYFILAILILLPSISYAQPDILWSRLYGGDGPDGFYDMQKTSDNGFVMAGVTNSFESLDSDYWVVKTNSSGDTLWTYQFRGSSIDVAYGISELSDSGFAVIGGSRSFGGFDADVYLIKLDRNGSPLWSRVYGGDFSDYGVSVVALDDKGLIISGKTISFGNDWQLYLIRVDSLGDTLWTKTYGGETDEEGALKIRELTNGNFIVLGFTESFGAGLEDYWLVKINQDGDTLWTKTYGGTESDVGRDLLETPDGGFILVGHTESFGNGRDDVWIVRTDSIGDTLWTKTYGNIYDDKGFSISHAKDGGYLILGHTQFPNQFLARLYLIRIDENGDSLWTYTLNTYASEGRSVTMTPDGWYAVAGWIKFESNGDIHGYLAKIIVRPYSLISADTIWIDGDFDGYAEGTLDGSASWNAEGYEVVAYEWRLGDDIIGTDSIITHSLPTGRHLVTLKVTDENGFSSSKEIEISILAFNTVLNENLNSTFTSSSDSVFFAFTGNNIIYKFNLPGEVQWSYPVNNKILSTLTISNNTLFANTQDSGIYAFDLDGNFLFNVPTGGMVNLSPAVDQNGNLYFGNISGDYYSINSGDGSINWKVNTEIPTVVSPALSKDGVIYTNGPDRSLLALNQDGTEAWRFDTDGWVYSSPAIGESGNIFFGSDNNILYKVSSEGEEVWQATLSSNVWGSPVIGTDGRVYVETSDGIVHALSSTASVLWTYDTGSGPDKLSPENPVILSDGRVCVFTDDGEIVLLDSNGNVDWSFDTRGKITHPPLITIDGFILVANDDRTLKGLALPDYTPGENSPWHTFQKNNQRTGYQGTLVSVKDNKTEILPTEYSLKQNYPNPFNPVTTIEYSLPKQSYVFLVIYNLNGQEVKRLVDRLKPAGNYSTNFDASQLSSGIYIYKLQAGRYSKTRKMVLLK